MKVKGVNLGNWLVLEKWMSPSLFDGTTAEDEYIFQHNFPKKFMRQKSKSIVLNIITERDSQESNRWEWMQSESLFRISSLATESLYRMYRRT